MIFLVSMVKIRERWQSLAWQYNTVWYFSAAIIYVQINLVACIDYTIIKRNITKKFGDKIIHHNFWNSSCFDQFIFLKEYLCDFFNNDYCQSSTEHLVSLTMMLGLPFQLACCLIICLLIDQLSPKCLIDISNWVEFHSNYHPHCQVSIFASLTRVNLLGWVCFVVQLIGS